MKKLVWILIIISVGLSAYNLKTETEIIKLNKKLDCINKKLLQIKNKK